MPPGALQKFHSGPHSFPHSGAASCAHCGDAALAFQTPVQPYGTANPHWQVTRPVEAPAAYGEDALVQTVAWGTCQACAAAAPQHAGAALEHQIVVCRGQPGWKPKNLRQALQDGGTRRWNKTVFMAYRPRNVAGRAIAPSQCTEYGGAILQIQPMKSKANHIAASRAQPWNDPDVCRGGLAGSASHAPHPQQHMKAKNFLFYSSALQATLCNGFTSQELVGSAAPCPLEIPAAHIGDGNANSQSQVGHISVDTSERT